MSGRGKEAVSAARVDRQSAATGGMVGMQAVACGADQHRGQDRHEAGVAGCPDGLAAAALSPVFFASLALEALAVVTCVVTLAEKPTLFSAGQLHRPLPQHCRAWQNGAVSLFFSDSFSLCCSC